MYHKNYTSICSPHNPSDENLLNGHEAFISLKRIAAFLLVSIAILIVLNDAYDIKNGWMHPETTVWSVKYLRSDTMSIYEKSAVSLNAAELKKIFWWEQFVDKGLTRLLTAAFSLVDIKFRAWLFQYIPPNPAVSLSWLFSLFFIPLLLFRFLRRYIKLGSIGSAVITVYFLASPATASVTFLNFHPGKMLAIFFMLLILNITMAFNEHENKKFGVFILLATALFFALYSDPAIFVIFLLIPIFFPKLFKKPCYYSIYLIYGVVMSAYFLSIFFIIPQISDWAGHSYKFMYGLKTETSGMDVPYLYIINPKFYFAIIANIYLFIVKGVGLGKILPLFINNDTVTINYYSSGAFLLFHIIFLGCCFISCKFSSNKRQVLTALIAFYITVVWITFMHGNSGFFLCYSGYFYGSLFSVVFAILLGAMLASFKKYTKVYVSIIVVIMTSSFFTYNHVKQINKEWKDIHYPNIDIDGFYMEYKKYWNDIKNNKIRFDKNICRIVVDNSMTNSQQIQQYIAYDKYQVKAINFAAFCR